MATHGNVGEFNHGAEDWTAYCERLEQYFTANDVDDAGKQKFCMVLQSMYIIMINDALILLSHLPMRGSQQVKVSL